MSMPHLARRFAPFAVAVLLAAMPAHADDPCAIAPGWKNLATCPLDASRNVTIGPTGCGQNVYVDSTTQGALGAPLGIITIAPGGLLIFADETGSDAALHVGTIDVQGTAGTPGTLQIGTSTCPITKGTATITFYGDRSSKAVPGGMPGDLSKGILVEAHGALVLHGGKGVAAIDPKSSSWNERLPAPTDLKKDIDDLETWVSGVEKRRK